MIPIAAADDISVQGRPLTLGDAALFEGVSGGSPFAPSEHCFANLWLFRARHRYRIADVPVPHLRGVTYDGVAHALPLAPPREADLRALASAGIDCLYPLDEETAAGLARRFGLLLAHDPADDDYWYDGPAMARLSGAKARRGQARRFAAGAMPVWEDMGAGFADDALGVLDGWAADVARPPERTDIAECREAIALASTLGLEGGIVRADGGEPVAFLLASRIGGTRIVHFAKGRRAHAGAYPWMFATYAERSGARRLNFEQDLGKPGLARSKRAYAPAHMQRKLRAGLVGLR